MITPLRERAAALLLAGLAGCSGQPIRYESQNELPSGPGLFSGSSGAFSWSTGNRDTASRQPTREAAPGPASSGPGATDAEAFRRYERAKQAGSDEWREFLEWKSWQDYQLWRKAQPTAPPSKP